MSTDRRAREALAQEHVAKGRAIVERQRELIARLRSLGHDTDEATRLLMQFETSLAIFEADLADLGVILTCETDEEAKQFAKERAARVQGELWRASVHVAGGPATSKRSH